MHRTLRHAWLALGALAAAAPVLATELIFEPDSGAFVDFAVMPAGYGDRVTATSQGGYLYGLGGGATPNVVTRYGSAGGLVELYTWAADFGDLQHVVFAREPIAFELRLIADPGYRVSLGSFDMAGWQNLSFASIASVSVEDGNGNVLFSQSNVPIAGDAIGPRHTHFAFANLSAGELRIKFDSTTNGQGVVLDSDDVGIDNIRFSQALASNVPEPGSAALLGLGLIGVLGLIRRRRPSAA